MQKCISNKKHIDSRMTNRALRPAPKVYVLYQKKSCGFYVGLFAFSMLEIGFTFFCGIDDSCNVMFAFGLFFREGILKIESYRQMYLVALTRI